jgi:hypothetical protein
MTALNARPPAIPWANWSPKINSRSVVCIDAS